MDYKSLMEAAQSARERAYAPYSKFCVGAALLCESGKVYTGCNIENASYSATVCAERVAIFAALASGENRFVAMAISGGNADEAGGFCAPCGVCRQVLTEFCQSDFSLVLGTAENYRVYTLGELMPLSFSLHD